MCSLDDYSDTAASCLQSTRKILNSDIFQAHSCLYVAQLNSFKNRNQSTLRSRAYTMDVDPFGMPEERRSPRKSKRGVGRPSECDPSGKSDHSLEQYDKSAILACLDAVTAHETQGNYILAIRLMDSVLTSGCTSTQVNLDIYCRIRLAELCMHFSSLNTISEQQLNSVWASLGSYSEVEWVEVKLVVLKSMLELAELRARDAKTAQEFNLAAAQVDSLISQALDLCGGIQWRGDIRWEVYFTICRYTWLIRRERNEEGLRLLIGTSNAIQCRGEKEEERRARTRPKRLSLQSSSSSESRLSTIPGLQDSLSAILHLQLSLHFTNEGKYDNSSKFLGAAEQDVANLPSSPTFELSTMRNLILICMDIRRGKFLSSIKRIQALEGESTLKNLLQTICTVYMGSSSAQHSNSPFNRLPTMLPHGPHFISNQICSTVEALATQIGSSLRSAQFDSCSAELAMFRHILVHLEPLKHTATFRRWNTLYLVGLALFRRSIGLNAVELLKHAFALALAGDQHMVSLHIENCLRSDPESDPLSTGPVDPASLEDLPAFLQILDSLKSSIGSGCSEKCAELSKVLEERNHEVGSLQAAIWCKIPNSTALSSAFALSSKSSYIEGEYYARKVMVNTTSFGSTTGAVQMTNLVSAENVLREYSTKVDQVWQMNQ